MRQLAMLLAGALVLPATAVMAGRSLEPVDQDPRPPSDRILTLSA